MSAYETLKTHLQSKQHTWLITGSAGFIGSMDSVRVWNKLLTDPELMQAQGKDQSLKDDASLGTNSGLSAEFLFHAGFTDSRSPDIRHPMWRKSVQG